MKSGGSGPVCFPWEFPAFRCMIIDNISLKYLIRGVKKKDEFINSKKNPHDICRNLSGWCQCGHFQGI